MCRLPSEGVNATTLRGAFAAALASRLASASQQDAVGLVPAYRLLVSLSRGAEPETAGSSADLTTAQATSATPSDSQAITAAASEGTDASASAGSRADATAAGAVTSAGTQSTACFVAELMITALQGGCSPAGSHTEDHRVGLHLGNLSPPISQTIAIPSCFRTKIGALCT